MDSAKVTILKIALTGHSSGFGPYLKTALEDLGHDVVGFSRSNGFDLSTGAGRDLAFALAHDCDVFINNSYAGGCQATILSEWLLHFYDYPKKIINISSNLALIEHPVEAVRDHRDSKRVLNLMHEFSKIGTPSKCTSELVSWGYWASHEFTKHHPELLTNMTIDEAIADIVRLL